MRTYKLTIAYDGTNYQGWQRQSDTDRTIQGILEETLENCTGYQGQIDGSGRTDAGVHASGQTASVVLPGKVDTALFTEKMNGCLPPDIRILDVELVKNGFHARKSAVGKVYEYRIDTGIKQDVFTRKYSGHFPGEPDLARMREAAGYLTGTHFFAGYTDKKDNRSVRRTIYSIMIRDERKDFLPCGKSDQIGNGNCIVIRYDGTGFLYHMVRILTGTLLEWVGMTCYPYGRDRNLPVIVWIRGTKVNSYYTASILGGDEFCVILTRNVDRIDQLNAAFACRLQNNRAQLPWLPDVSTGYAVFDTSEEELGSAVERADAAMYRVKNEKKAAARS